jgi:hypothetical protein
LPKGWIFPSLAKRDEGRFSKNIIYELFKERR